MTGYTKKNCHNDIVLQLNANSFPSTLILLLIQWNISSEAFAVCQVFTKADICCTI